jgi:hypothetical protein
MVHSRKELKTHYSISDFLFHIFLLSVSLFTAVLSILKESVLWTMVFIGLGAGITVIVLKFYCTRCPHYTREGKYLKCIFFWRLPKFFTNRPGKLDISDKVITYSATIVLLIFPVYWLLMTPGLLIVYLLSLIALGAAISFTECDRCIYFECPANRVPEAIKNS